MAAATQTDMQIAAAIAEIAHEYEAALLAEGYGLEQSPMGFVDARETIGQTGWYSNFSLEIKMTISVEASIVEGDSVTLIDPVNASYYDLLSAVTDGPQIAPESEYPIPDPLTGQILRYLDGVVIGSTLGGLGGTGTATAGALLLADQSIDLSQEATMVVFTFEQTDGTQLVIRATVTGGDGPTLQEFADGYTVEDLLADTDTLNSQPYEFEASEEDDFTGDDGPDNFTGSDGADEMVGGAGNDTLSGGQGDDTLRGGSGDDVIETGSGDNRARGASGDDSISGGSGNDLLGGGVGADTLRGGAGQDTLYGGGGDDVIVAGSGADIIGSGAGNDTVTGGAGADEFRFMTRSMNSGEIDVVTDFEDGVDMIGIGVSSFLDLEITDGATGAEVAVDGYTVILEGVSSADLSADDFLFT